jgi:broad specificity phosphatase PhoE
MTTGGWRTIFDASDRSPTLVVGAVAILVLLVTLLLAACALLHPPAARRLDLTGTSWSVVEIDGHPVVTRRKQLSSFQT